VPDTNARTDSPSPSRGEPRPVRRRTRTFRPNYLSFSGTYQCNLSCPLPRPFRRISATMSLKVSDNCGRLLYFSPESTAVGSPAAAGQNKSILCFSG
jgi:hypothetical protein